MRRIGVFICHCGLNIAGKVEVARVTEVIRSHPGVAHTVDYTYMCSDPGQDMIKNSIDEKNLDGVVVADDIQPGLQSSQMGLYIGTGKAMKPGTYFSGLIDDIRIYDEVLSAEEVAELAR